MVDSKSKTLANAPKNYDKNIWKQLEEKLPWKDTPADKQKREQFWKQFDVNGNNYISLAEIDKGMRDVVVLPNLFAAKPVLMRAYMAAKAISQAKNQHSDDYITKGEFKYLFKFLRQYYEFFIAFNKIDNGQDQRIDKKEFLSSAPMLQTWGVETSNMEQKWKEADKDGKGQILFIEFVNWAFNNKLDLEDDDDADNFENIPRQQSNKNSQGSNNQANFNKQSSIQNVTQGNAKTPRNGKVDDIWKQLEEKLPWRNTPQDKAKRDQFWSGFDVNGNGYISLAEIDKGMRDVVVLPNLFAAKPVLMRAYMAAKSISQSKSKHSDDYITKGEEFRYLFKFLRQYYEFFIAFNKIDNGMDQRVDKKEFMQAAPMLQKWNIDISNLDQQWKSADKDGKGQILFIEFVDWAFNQKLDLDDDDDADDFESAPRQKTQVKVSQATNNQNNSSRQKQNPSQVNSKVLTTAQSKVDDIWKVLEDKLPWTNSPADKAKRDKFWNGFDVNGNGYLSLAEIDKGMRDVVVLPNLFAAKPVLMRAFMAAKAISKQKNKHSDDYITKGEEFRCLFKFLRQYYEFFIAFNKIDNGQDQRIDKQEFLQAAPLLQKWNIDTSNMEQQWRDADKDGKGQVLFIEFVNWAFNKKLDLDDDDDKDDFDGVLKQSPQKVPGVNKKQPRPQNNVASSVTKPATINPKQVSSSKVDDIWKQLEDKLPWRNTPADKAKRDKYWNGFDVNGNGYLSLAEIDKGMRDVVVLPNLFAAKPVLMRAFMAAKAISKSKNKHSDDYITKGEEFRYLFKFMRQYYEFFIAFNKIDDGKDQRIDKSEFLKAAPLLQKWSIDTKNMERLWKEADRDGKGQVLFIEFVQWAFNKKLDLDDDDDADDFQTNSQGSALKKSKTVSEKKPSVYKQQAISQSQKTPQEKTKVAGKVDDIWKVLQEKLPWSNSTADKAKREKYWNGFDVNGNGYLSLAEIDKGMRDVVVLPNLFAAKPVLMRAYMAAKAISKSKNKHSDDYITKGEEFRYLFKFMRQYYEFFIAFNKIDNGQDQRVDKKEFMQAASLLSKWGIDTTNMEKQWKEADKDGKGQVLFIEFVNWAFNKKLDLDDDDNQDDYTDAPQRQREDITFGRRQATQKNSKSQRQQNTNDLAKQSPIKGQVQQKSNDIWKQLEEKLPWRNTPADKAKRDKFWSGFDVNGNGYISLAEIDKGMRDVVVLPNLFAAKPVLMRAYMAAKSISKSKNKRSDDYITKGEEFRYLFKFLRQYYEFFIAFNKIDTGQDQRVDKKEFAQAVPLLKKWGIDTSDMERQWREVDSDGKGQVLFMEFVNWAFNKRLDLEDDDNKDYSEDQPYVSPPKKTKQLVRQSFDQGYYEKQLNFKTDFKSPKRSLQPPQSNFIQSEESRYPQTPKRDKALSEDHYKDLQSFQTIEKDRNSRHASSNIFVQAYDLVKRVLSKEERELYRLEKLLVLERERAEKKRLQEQMIETKLSRQSLNAQKYLQTREQSQRQKNDESLQRARDLELLNQEHNMSIQQKMLIEAEKLRSIEQEKLRIQKIRQQQAEEKKQQYFDRLQNYHQKQVQHINQLENKLETKRMSAEMALQEQRQMIQKQLRERAQLKFERMMEAQQSKATLANQELQYRQQTLAIKEQQAIEHRKMMEQKYKESAEIRLKTAREKERLKAQINQLRY